MDVSVFQRNDLLLQVTVEDETGVPIDLTGATLTFVVNGGSITKTTAGGITITDAVNGKIEVDLTHDDTDIPKGSYHLELLVTDVDGNRYTAATGTLTVEHSLVG